MKNLVLKFPAQLTEALSIGQNYKFKTPVKEFANVMVTGLGGSGIGGSIVQNYVADKMKIPFLVNKDYFLPAFVGSNSLVIVCSYSGNTEETLEAMQQALKAKATVVCVTSGGKVAEIAGKKKLDCIVVPGGMPPRSCLGYSLVQLLCYLGHFGLIERSYEKDLNAAITLISEGQDAIRKSAKQVAKKLLDKTPIIYSAGNFEGVAIRFRQQISENSKMLCWNAVIPEMNHNELVGWRDAAKDKAVVILRNKDDYDRVQTRMDINKKVIGKYTKNIIEIYSEGKSYWEKAFYLIHLTDWVSVILADLRELDATEVKVIDFLKGELAKV